MGYYHGRDAQTMDLGDVDGEVLLLCFLSERALSNC